MKIDLLGVKINAEPKETILREIGGLLQKGRPNFITTPYSESVVSAQKDEEFRNVLNSADFALPDGIGLLWAAKFLNTPPPQAWGGQGRGRWFWLVGELLKSLLAIIFYPKTTQVWITGEMICTYYRLTSRTVVKPKSTGIGGSCCQKTNPNTTGIIDPNFSESSLSESNDIGEICTSHGTTRNFGRGHGIIVYLAITDACPQSCGDRICCDGNARTRTHIQGDISRSDATR